MLQLCWVASVWGVCCFFIVVVVVVAFEVFVCYVVSIWDIMGVKCFSLLYNPGISGMIGKYAIHK